MLSVNRELMEDLVAIAREAGDVIMEIYRKSDVETDTKTDGDYVSPVTEADMASNKVLMHGLSELTPEMLVVSEEVEESHAKAYDTEEFWIIDPLDGTKEFIKKGTDFTVNIGLIRAGVPVAGVVYAPARGIAYWGFEDGAFKQADGNIEQINVSESTSVKSAVASKSHFDETTANFLKQFGEIKFVQAGSSLKICLVAEGEAEIYPRFAPTMEWDTAAGDAVLRAAGGQMLDTSGNTFRYLKPGLRNPGFICVSGNIGFELE